MSELNQRQTRSRRLQRDEKTHDGESKENETETVLLSPNQSNEENTTKTARAGRPKLKSKLPAIICGDGQHEKKVDVNALELQHAYDVVMNAMIDCPRQQIYSYLYHVVKGM